MITLQNVIFPDLEICSEQDLFVRLDPLVALDIASETLHFLEGGQADLGTYFNALSLRKWNSDNQLDDLFLSLQGEGTFEVRVYHALPERSWEMILCQVVDLSAEQEISCDISASLRNPDQGLLYAQIKALDTGKITKMRFVTNTVPKAWPDLTVSITTFKREADVERTVERLQTFLTDYEHADHVKVLVIDNGQSATIPASKYVSYFPNDNLGGAGGFARGLMEAERAGASHVLFTDDDAAFNMESLHRTYIFLALAKDSRTTVAGAMINNVDKWAMSENGAVFKQYCQPISAGQDLRSLKSVFDMEMYSADFKSPNMYGGWWFFAFPVKHAVYHPYPFFVRGDDSSFSLANDFRITTLNGVVSFQDSFVEKQSPMTEYLDTRYHVVHHLALPRMKLGALRTAKIPAKFAILNVIRFHYETAEACLLAWEDVMSGPEFFPANKDMSERRNHLKSIVKQEVFEPMEHTEITDWADTHQRIPKWRLPWLRMTLNGHLFPVRRSAPTEVAVPPRNRPNLHMVWGKSALTYLAPGRRKAYTVRFDRARGLKLFWRTLKNTMRFIRNYDDLLAAYQADYPKTASPEFWNTVYQPKTPALEEDTRARQIG